MVNYCRQHGSSPRLGKTRNYTSELFCQEQDLVAHTRHPKLRRQRQEGQKFKVIFIYTMSLRVAWPYSNSLSRHLTPSRQKQWKNYSSKKQRIWSSFLPNCMLGWLRINPEYRDQSTPLWPENTWRQKSPEAQLCDKLPVADFSEVWKEGAMRENKERDKDKIWCHLHSLSS